MAQKKKLKDYAIAIVRELISGPAEEEEARVVEGASLDDVKLDDLRRERVRLEQEERKMLARLRDVENKKRKLFEDGVKNPSEREQRVIARRIKELDVRANNMDRMLQAISKQMRVINGLTQVKERNRMMAETGLSQLVADIDLGELIHYVDEASVDGEFHMDKFDELLGVLEEADSLSPEYREDQDVLEIVKVMQDAREAADDPEALENKYSEFKKKMVEKDEGDEFEPLEGEF